MKIHIQLFIMLIFFILINIVDVEARSEDEPCSYLNPEKYIRDANGNCIAKSNTSSQTIQRSTDEPCSYLNPPVAIRDPNTGKCIPVDGRSTDEPCSYLNPPVAIRDPNTGKCIPVKQLQPTIISETPNNTQNAPTDDGSMFSGIGIGLFIGVIILAMRYLPKKSRRGNFVAGPRHYSYKKSHRGNFVADPESYGSIHNPPTQDQLNALDNLGYDGPEPSSSAHADRLIKKGPRKQFW